MERIYRKVRPAEPLSQGDIFANIPIPDVSFSEASRYELIDGGGLREAAVVGDIKDGMNFVATVNLTAAIVLDQSCETLKVDRILLAPLVAFSAPANKKEKWQYIKKLGSSSGEPSRIYLADDAELGLPKQIIDLGAKFTLNREDMETFLKEGKRLATLSLKNLLYLQNRLANYFSRTARDDEDWLSVEDLELKIELTREERDRKANSIPGLEGQARAARSEDDVRRCEAKVEDTKAYVNVLEGEIDAATAALERIKDSNGEVVAPELDGQIPPESVGPERILPATTIQVANASEDLEK